jgi:gliding motility-associated-like protein
MNNIFTLIFIFCVSIKASSQNLVPNPSFELYNSCPTTLGALGYSPTFSLFPTVQSWANPARLGTPDYHNKCATSPTLVSIPSNFTGIQQAKTGNAYAGIYAFYGTPNTSGSSEYIICKLTQPMVANKRYRAGYWASLAEKNINPFNHVAVNVLGAFFSDTMMYRPGLPAEFSNIPYSINSIPGNFLDDTTNWMKISGSYVAKGGEQYMLIGRMLDGNPPALKQITPVPPLSPAISVAYYYIDDVFVEDFYCDTTYFSHDSSICDIRPLQLTSINNAKLYKWNTGATTQSIFITQPGMYWCHAGSDTCDLRIDTFRVVGYAQTIPTSQTLYGCHYNGRFTLSLSAGQTANSYLWNTGDTTKTINVSDTGTYYCSYAENCRLHIDTIHVRTFQKYTNITTDTLVCVSKRPFNATLNNIANAKDYLWYNGATTQSITITDTGKYWCRAVSGCDLVTTNYRVSHIPFDADIKLGNDTTVCKDKRELIIGKSVIGVTEYLWNSGETICCIQPNSPGLYTLTIGNGCDKKVDSITIAMADCENCVKVPSAFSPNNDTRNDKIKPIVICPVNSIAFKVYNRWGNLVFDSGSTNQAWDGTYNGIPCDIGVYYYVVSYTVAGDNEKRIVKGDITLLR